MGHELHIVYIFSQSSQDFSVFVSELWFLMRIESGPPNSPVALELQRQEAQLEFDDMGHVPGNPSYRLNEQVARPRALVCV